MISGLNLDINSIVIGVIGAILTAVGSVLAFFAKKIINESAQVKTDIAVIKTQISSALDLRNDVLENGKDLIRLDERLKKVTKDVDALHCSKRDILQKLSNH